ncbi:MAG: hypothetical protein CBB60_009670 [Armatimonadetes bacterium Cent15-Ar3]|nr:MAG: hypothetical protein CBB60_009670 [Armatimonadetes bacterium Cent15-Ar3]
MKRLLGVLLIGIALCAANQPATVCAETESIDLKALAKKARPAVMLLVVSDANGKEIATGTGFLVSADGKLITNFHVIENAASAVAKAENGGLFPVEGVLASDPKNDLVLLKIKGKELPFLTLGKSENIEVGTRIAVIGSPLGLEGTLSEGIVSAVRELMGDMKVLQVTAAISPGSSGSPVLNVKGEVVGVAASLLRGGQSLNFAVPAECGVRLMAKIRSSSELHPLNHPANTTGEDAIYYDADWLRAWVAEASKDHVEMLKRTKVLVVRYPENAVAWYALGWAFSNLKFTDDAIAAYLRAIKVNPDYGNAWRRLGGEYQNTGRIAEAIAACRQAIKSNPDDPYAWGLLGMMYQQTGHTNDAIEAFERSVRISPSIHGGWLLLGYAYGSVGRTDDALGAHRQAIKIMPDDASAWRGLGVVYKQLGQTNETIGAFRRAAEIKQNDSDAWG